MPIPEHDDVAYVKDALQAAFLILAAAWLLRELVRGNGGGVKAAVRAA